MPFPMKVQPFDPGSVPKALPAGGSDNPTVVALKPLPQKSRLKRLLERQFRAVPAAALPPAAAAAASLLLPQRVPASGDAKDKDDSTEAAGGGTNAAGAAQPEPSSLCLSKMVHNFLEGNNDKPARCGRRRCSCFNGSNDDSSDDDIDCCGEHHPASSDVSEIVKSLVSCSGVAERSLLAEVCKIIERARMKTDKDDASRRRVVVDTLISLGYDASVCKSRWEKSATVPEGEYEYIDVVVVDGPAGGSGENDRRVLIDIDFRSEFEIARATKRYRAVLQSLPAVFVGRADRLQQIVAVVSEAARQSLKKRGLHVPPWRKSDYMKAKWLSPYQRSVTPAAAAANTTAAASNLIHDAIPDKEESGGSEIGGRDRDGVGNVVGVRNPASSADGDRPLTQPSELVGFSPVAPGKEVEEKPGGCGLAVCVEAVLTQVPASEWQPPAVTPKARTPRGAKVVTGLTSMILAEKENVDG